MSRTPKLQFLTVQLRLRVRNPWPKLYICDPKHKDVLIQGFPCCLVLDSSYLPDSWYKSVGAMKIEEGGRRAMKRGDCHDDFFRWENEGEGEPRPIDKRELSHMTKELLGVAFKDATIVVPIFQRHLNWRVSDVPAELIQSPNATTAVWMFEETPQDKHKVSMQNDGPPIKLPNGTLIESCCSACKFNFENLQGRCNFGSSVCMEKMEFPGKSSMVANLRRYAEHRAAMSLHDTQTDLPAVQVGDGPQQPVPPLKVKKVKKKKKKAKAKKK